MTTYATYDADLAYDYPLAYDAEVLDSHYSTDLHIGMRDWYVPPEFGVPNAPAAKPPAVAPLPARVVKSIRGRCTNTAQSAEASGRGKVRRAIAGRGQAGAPTAATIAGSGSVRRFVDPEDDMLVLAAFDMTSIFAE